VLTSMTEIVQRAAREMKSRLTRQSNFCECRFGSNELVMHVLSRVNLRWRPTGIAGKIEEGLFRQGNAIDSEFEDGRHPVAAR
jgi:hypothetical protein